jgi:hypothetical protein
MISKHAVLPTGADNLRIGYNTLGVNLKRLEHKIDLVFLFVA